MHLISRNKLKQLMDLHGIGQEELASWCDTSQGYISRCASGLSLPNVALAIRIAERFGCQVEDIWQFGVDDAT